jgi:HSP20 family protein
MSLINRNPQNTLFPAFSSWIDDVFPENAFKTIKNVSIPAVNITETNDVFKLKVAAPGFKKEEFKLEVQNGMLTISGETKEEKEEKDERYTRQEYAFSSFSRSFAVPENVNGEAITAEYADGVLNVILPKKQADERPSVQIVVK